DRRRGRPDAPLARCAAHYRFPADALRPGVGAPPPPRTAPDRRRADFAQTGGGWPAAQLQREPGRKSGMATEYSFDIVSKVDLTEVKNAIDQAEREISGRFDFRGTKTAFTQEENSIKILSDDEFHLNMVLDILRSKLAKRNVSLKA